MTEVSERPRDRIYSFCLDRLASLAAHATISCREPSCGARDPETNEVVSCASKNCGERLMLHGHRRELQVMKDIRALIEALERAELERIAAEGRRGKK